MKQALALALCAASVGCGVNGRSNAHGVGDAGGSGTLDLAGFSNADQAGGGQAGCGELTGCYTVYAHGDHTLYRLDLQNKAIELVGPFHAPMVTVSGKMEEDVITDLAVAPDDTIYVISHTTLYTASATDGHVTVVGNVSVCGTENVALTFSPDGTLYAADYKGAFCKIDTSSNPPRVTQIGTLGQGLAVSGDLVAIDDGTMFATAYSLTDSTTSKNNALVTIAPTTGAASAPIGSTGFPKLYGVAYDNGLVYGFTHDGSGDVVTIDPKTGHGTLYGSFKDPQTAMPISFAGAGVNAMVMAQPPG